MMRSVSKEKINLKSLLKDDQIKSYFGLIIVLTLLITIFSFRSDYFFTIGNFNNILKQISVFGIIACGQAFAMITAGIDLQVGSVTGLCGVIAAKLVMGASLNLYLAIAIALVFGAIFGIIAGSIISQTGIPPFIMTLGMMISLRGLAYIVSAGRPIGNLPDSFLNLALGKFIGIPIPVFIMGLVFLIISFVLSKTSFGRSVYAVGGNYEAAVHSGLNAKRILMYCYMISGLLSALAGIILTARNASAQPTAGNGFELEAIAACAMGGVAFTGGKGSVFGIFLGALLMGVINNGMNMMYISSYWQLVVRGIIIVSAVLYSIYSSNNN